MYKYYVQYRKFTGHAGSQCLQNYWLCIWKQDMKMNYSSTPKLHKNALLKATHWRLFKTDFIVYGNELNLCDLFLNLVLQLHGFIFLGDYSWTVGMPNAHMQ